MSEDQPIYGGESPITEDQREEFREQVRKAVNWSSMENGSDTPDWIIANFLVAVLDAADTMVRAREQWYGRKVSE